MIYLPFLHRWLFPITTFCSIYRKIHFKVGSFMGRKCSWSACSSLGGLLEHFLKWMWHLPSPIHQRCPYDLHALSNTTVALQGPWPGLSWPLDDSMDLVLVKLPLTLSSPTAVSQLHNNHFIALVSLDFNGTHATIHPLTLLYFLHLLLVV